MAGEGRYPVILGSDDWPMTVDWVASGFGRDHPSGERYSYGSAASRNPSPKKLKASTVMITGTIGSSNHG